MDLETRGAVIALHAFTVQAVQLAVARLSPMCSPIVLRRDHLNCSKEARLVASPDEVLLVVVPPSDKTIDFNTADAVLQADPALSDQAAAGLIVSEAISLLHPFSQLRALESEAIYIIREVAATFAKPVMLFSGGKDSVVMLHLAAKAFWPSPIPFGILHVDTGHNFAEVIAQRDEAVAFYGAHLSVVRVQDYLDDGRLQECPDGTRNPLQTVPLLDAITNGQHDAVFGGGRRDEERSRAKERVFSLRDAFGQWDPHIQRPELWSLYNGRHAPGEHVRVFPLSNWTELDVWEYIAAEKIALPSIYYAHDRDVVQRDNMWIAITPVTPARPSELVTTRSVRYRTVGDMSCTAAVLSEATTVADVIAEVAVSTLSERGATRADDRLSEAAMEDRKREGYF